MTLRSKVVLALVGMFCLFVGADSAVQRWVFLPSFLELEREEATKDIARCREALTREIEHLSLICEDWAHWTDTYDFVVDRNQRYYDSNLLETSFATPKLNLIYIVNTEGEVVFGRVRDLEAEEWIPLPVFPADRFPADSLLLEHGEGEKGVSGVIMTSRGPMLIASHSLLTSQESGPTHGSIMMGRFLTADIVSQLREQTKVDLAIWSVPDGEVPVDDLRAIAALSDATPEYLVERNASTMGAFAFASDIFGKKALLLKADVPRDISAKGHATMRFATLSVVAVGLVTMLVLLTLLQKMVVSPLTNLTTHAQKIATSRNLSARLNLVRHDEIGTLGSAFDTMVGRLAQAQRELSDASRDAGKAEVASGILHNVGNVLNSVNVSACRATQQLQEIDVADVSTIAQLIDTHKGELGEFLSNDEKGMLIPEYLTELGTHLSEGQQGVLEELRSLESNLEHIKQIVNMQQEYASASGVLEPIELSSVLEDAIGINAAAFERHGITTSVELPRLPEIKTDRHKVMQIFVNLLSNAKHALGDVEPAKREIVVRALGSEDGCAVHVEVCDNGCGIEADNLTRVFTHGFTTREDGHGFGLHSCALAAKELGGSLVARSAGLGLGATFTLTLPSQHVEAAG